MTTDSTWTATKENEYVTGNHRVQNWTWSGTGTQCTGGIVNSGFAVVVSAFVWDGYLTTFVPATASGGIVTITLASGTTNSGKLRVEGQ